MILGLNFIDIQRVKTHATEEAIYLATQQSDALAQSQGEAASYFHPELDDTRSSHRSGESEATSYLNPQFNSPASHAPAYDRPPNGPPRAEPVPGPGEVTSPQPPIGSDRAPVQSSLGPKYDAPQGPPPPGHPSFAPSSSYSHEANYRRTPSPQTVPVTREIGVLYPPRRHGLIRTVIEGSFQHPGPQYVQLEPHRHQGLE